MATAVADAAVVVVTRARQQGIRGASAIIVAAQKQGYSPGLNIELAASALCSMLEYSCYNWTAKGGDFPDRVIDDQSAVDVLTQLFLHAIGWESVTQASYSDASAVIAASIERSTAKQEDCRIAGPAWPTRPCRCLR